MKRPFTGNRRSIGISILAASIAAAFPAPASALDYVWISGNYSASGNPLTISSGDRLLTQSASNKVFDVASFLNNGVVAQADDHLYFANLNLMGFSGLTFEVLYNAGDVTLRVAAVPEPSEWMMMLAGLAVLGMIARRRNRGAAA